MGRPITALALLTTALLSACATTESASVNVPQPLGDRPKVATIQIIQSDASDTEPSESRTYGIPRKFEIMIRRYFLEGANARFREGSDITIAYRIIEYIPG